MMGGNRKLSEEMAFNEAREHVESETQEHKRYMDRLNRANERQMQIFAQHYNSFTKKEDDER